MPSEVIGHLNQNVARQFTPTDIGNGNFLSVSVEQNPGSSIYGVTFGFHISPEPALPWPFGVFCVILQDFIPDPLRSIYVQLRMAAAPNHENPYMCLYQGHTHNDKTSESEGFIPPIEVGAGRPYSIVVAVYNNGLGGFGGTTVTPYLSVRGQFRSGGGHNVPKPKGPR